VPILPCVRRGPSGKQGFTLIELLVVCAIIAVLTAVAIPLLVSGHDRAVATECLTERAYADRAQVLYTCEHGKWAEDLETLVDERLLDTVPVCPAGGHYSWVPLDGDRFVLACSAHPEEWAAAPLTPLGSTFGEITGGIASLIDAFYAAHGHYPRTWGEFVFADIGLDPEDWQDPVGGVIYKPGGNRVSVRPAPGYDFQVQKPDGTTLVLTNKVNWNLVYDNATKNWYYHSIDPANVIDIDTLVVRPV